MDEYDLGIEQPEEFYAQVILTVQDRAPLLAIPRLARLAMEALAVCAAHAPGSLWGYIVLPESIRLIVGPADDETLALFVDDVKQRTEQPLLEAILRADDSSLDMVLHYTPVWGGVIYHVWEPGCHRHTFWTEYKLSNALYDMFQVPVMAGLVGQIEDWPYRWTGGNA